ncbi:MAG: hypothetical protein AAF628_26115 [Planctomycetota bacterium]
MNGRRLASFVAATIAAAATVTAQDPDLLDLIDANELAEWRVLGPFPSPEHAGLDIPFIDEQSPDLTKSHALPDGDLLEWRAVDAEHPLPDGKKCRLDHVLGDWDTVYLWRTIRAIGDHEAIIGLGFDDSAALWVNGEEVFRRKANQGVTVDQHALNVQLQTGDNTVLLKVVNDRGASGFAFRLTDQIAGQNRWGAGIEDDGHASYAISTVPLPDDIVLEVGGLLFRPDGSLLVACRRGQIYCIHNPAERDPEKLEISTFAEGLHEPLGLYLEADGALLASQMPEMTRLRDVDGDGRADEYETVTAAWGLSGNYHEYHFGPVRDAAGDLWATLNIGFPSGKGDELRYRGSAYRLGPDGEFQITCYGLRSPNGLLVNDAGDVFYTDNQGEWMDVCRLSHLRPNRFYGHPVAKPWAEAMSDFGWATEPTPPAIWYPYHLVRSASWPVVDRTDGAFGPYAGQIILGDQNNSLLVRTTLERVGDTYQGACYPFWQAFGGGINRLAFDADGVLYVGLTNRGWGSVRGMAHGLQRFEFQGTTPFDLLEARVTQDGWEIEFTKPLSPESNLTPRHIRVREYGYRYWSTYGSDEFDERNIDVLDARLSADRKRVALRCGPRQIGKVFQIQFRGTITSADGEAPITQEAFYTLQRLPGS